MTCILYNILKSFIIAMVFNMRVSHTLSKPTILRYFEKSLKFQGNVDQPHVNMR